MLGDLRVQVQNLHVLFDCERLQAAIALDSDLGLFRLMSRSAQISLLVHLLSLRVVFH